MTREEATRRNTMQNEHKPCHTCCIHNAKPKECQNCMRYVQYNELDYGECKIGGCRFEVYPNNTCVYFVKSTEREG